MEGSPSKGLMDKCDKTAAIFNPILNFITLSIYYFFISVSRTKLAEKRKPDFCQKYDFIFDRITFFANVRIWK